ncbi:MAG: RecX family transcriptional regulator [Sphingobacteriales bacterium]|jgi:regulatory protein|nr:RecX family transcriptional regulator [Sphingobacteriales bacterium]MBP9142236.1 RecX family transcriptional regulator [Chitinophagales bacterium]MDA0199139.1 regulatory protein RecX [Bacteroidota bacterium]MBK6890781.1 RecX family transcriptional regulator [Sphingobacteriales bacterium]MBK7526166.1 RecX family transcriptional regulator [Sphingobacteriales bacterium]
MLNSNHHQQTIPTYPYLLQRLQKYCAYQERSEDEVLRKLKLLHAPPQIAQQVLRDLIADGFVNNQRFAKAFARGHFKLKKWGPAKITAALKMHKLPASLIKEALEEVVQQTDTQNNIALLATKKWESLNKTNDTTAQKRLKLLRFLVGKGYATAEAIAAIEQVLRSQNLDNQPLDDE